MGQIEDSIYDVTEEVEYIKKNLPQDAREAFSDDDITYITDVVYDYFESNGFLEEEEEVEIDMDEITAFVMKNAKRDGYKFDKDLAYWVIDRDINFIEGVEE
ncbi:MAG: hypothetical protein HUJ97_01295 [Bacteroidales bacterium]|nr:hypothetical protein [Bacteroidales bacterium]